jgi:hypothetical protein
MVDVSGYVGESTSIVLDSNDHPRISYYDRTTTSIKYAEWTGDNWDIMTLDSYSNVGKYSNMALDSDDDPHISYYDSVFQELKYAGRHRGLWSLKTLDTHGDVGKYSSIAVSDSGHIHISYYDETNGDLRYILWDGNRWNIYTIDSDGDVGRFTSIALDSEGKPCISYIDYTNAVLKYAKCTGSQWRTQGIAVVNLQDESSLDFGSGTSLDLDSQDQPHIVFVGGKEDNLRYARWDGTGWIVRDVGNVRDVYLFVSLALDSMDRPHISYYTKYDNKVHYAKWTGFEWEVVYVLPKSYFQTAGKFNSIALDSEDYAHISYFDTSSRNLRYARFYDSIGSLEEVDFDDDSGMIRIEIPDIDPIYITPTINDTEWAPVERRDPASVPFKDLMEALNSSGGTVTVYNPGSGEIPQKNDPYDYGWLSDKKEPPTVDPKYPYYDNSFQETSGGSDLGDGQMNGVDNSGYVVIFATFVILILTILLVSLMSIYKGNLPNRKK